MDDKRLFLKVKLKALAAEAQIIRREEKRQRGQTRFDLHDHRILVVRRAARETHIAYGLIRGRTYRQIERTAKSEPDWKAIEKMGKRYGSDGWELPPPEVLKLTESPARNSG